MMVENTNLGSLIKAQYPNLREVIWAFDWAPSKSHNTAIRLFNAMVHGTTRYAHSSVDIAVFIEYKHC